MIQDFNKEHNQYRQMYKSTEHQFTDNPDCKECDMCLETWEDYPRQQTECRRCETKSWKGSEELMTAICRWRCGHDIEVCIRCIPVVLRTPLIKK